MMPLTPWVKRLLAANVVMFLVTSASPLLTRLLLLYPPEILLRPWSAVTYMFLHGGFGHLFFNMIGLFFFGPRLEDRLGGKIFLWLYFLSGLGGAVFSFIFAAQYPVVGASGGVYGVLLGFAMFWPRERILLFPIPIPIQAWLLITFYFVFSVYAGISGAQSGTAHFAHLGGLVFAFAFLKWWEWRRGAGRREFQRRLAPKPAGLSDRAAAARWKKISLEGLHEINREEVERLLAKVGVEGTRSLTQAEREFLDRMAGG
jgi:membrane associated rhomboid family serine protease